MVRFHEVGFAYPPPPGSGGPPIGVLRGLSFTLEPGSFTWILGPSGAGKSTVLRLIHLALRPSEGEVEVLGVPVSQARADTLPRLRRRIGVVFQDYRLLPYLTAAENVALPLRLARRPEAEIAADVGELLRWVGLEDRADALPPTLSGGEQQRIAFARAVIARPDLIVADEPTGNLDAAQARRLLALLAEMNRLGTTVVVATHSEELVEYMPAPALVLRAGRAHLRGGNGADDGAA
ncbi:MAG: ATP-binding cassette domain-containing protein [Acetobacteraceae bacterium]|nr:ATP-binding cassette domain-containing protein [Acetobacteraceae bacterium]MDW8399436.1 ATP-binding cassette domain-containing protein [Acetobacteraceae bacterium]